MTRVGSQCHRKKNRYYTAVRPT